MTIRTKPALVFLVLALDAAWDAQAQIDPERRRLLQMGFNQPIEGRGPIAAYGFFYYNQPNFFHTNLTLRAAIAPVYLDTELGFSGLLGAQTDVGVGLAGGGFADTYSEVRQGTLKRAESFTGHSAEVSTSLYHKFNPNQMVPLSGILRGSVHRAFYEKDNETADNFELPDDRTSFNVRAGLRFGGQAPTMTDPLAMEVSTWYEGQFRTDAGPYGFAGDRQVESNSHLIWGRALLKYTFDKTRQLVELSVTGGTTVNADRFSAYRMGGVLPFSSEFPHNIPGYYYQELSAKGFVLLNGQYSFPIALGKSWSGTLVAATGTVDYLDGLEQPGNWHSGVGGGLTYKSPAGSWFVSLIYGHGFDAIRSHGRGANQVGVLLQYDFEAKAKWFTPGVSPYRSRGLERLFRD